MEEKNEVLEYIDVIYEDIIATFGHQVDLEKVRCFFKNGWCFAFANVLKGAFRRGEVCLAAPFSHIVFLDKDGTPYDIDGVYKGEAFYFIPISYLSEDDIKVFAHLPSANSSSLTKEYCIEVMKRYCNEHNIEYDSRCEKYLAE